MVPCGQLKTQRLEGIVNGDWLIVFGLFIGAGGACQWWVWKYINHLFKDNV